MPSPGKIEQYDVSPQEYRNIQDRRQLRQELRKEFLRLYENPHRLGTGEGGFALDPVLQRWMALKAQAWHYFKPNPKTLVYPLMVLIPIAIYGYLVDTDRRKRETEKRNGLVSYRDRTDKWVH